MADRLKDIFFTRESINHMADTILKYDPEFEKKKFIRLVFDENWEQLELKARMRHTTLCLHETLPQNYKLALDILVKIAPFIKGFDAMVLPDYVEVYGLDNWDLSLPALGYFTKYSSSEFAIRPFLVQDPDRVMPFVNKWAEDTNKSVRRFASEGIRPRLPWAMALPAFKKDPSPILPILEKLKDDESEFVRRSVANNLNDISKDHPDTVLELCEQWYGVSDKTDWIVKHACRGMLKAGNKRALLLFGHSDPANITVEALELDKKSVEIGNDVNYSFKMTIAGQDACKIRLEYVIHFVKSNGKQSKKIFKITENDYKPGYLYIFQKTFLCGYVNSKTF